MTRKTLTLMGIKHLPKEWVENVLKKGIYNPAFTVFNRNEAIDICERYLKTIDRTQWPLLIGMHPIMDQVLGQAFSSSKLRIPSNWKKDIVCIQSHK